MLSKYDKMAIFKILEPQIDNRFHCRHPYDNPLEKAAELFWDSMCENGVMHLNKVKYPDMRWTRLWYVWPCVYAEVILIHHLFDDVYDEKNVSMLENMCGGKLEGAYCFNNVTVEKGDVVIDAGAFLGDWSAVAAQMGGKVYAFEPSTDEVVTNFIKKTAELNDFQYIQCGLGDETGRGMLRTDIPTGEQQISRDGVVGTGIFCNMTTVDDFAAENNIHVDFIKSDIEGFERFMLLGAMKTLRKDQPKLSIKTYHTIYGNDKEYLPQLIKNINPNYKIIERKKTLYAYVD